MIQPESASYEGALFFFLAGIYNYKYKLLLRVKIIFQKLSKELFLIIFIKKGEDVNETIY